MDDRKIVDGLNDLEELQGAYTNPNSIQIQVLGAARDYLYGILPPRYRNRVGELTLRLDISFKNAGKYKVGNACLLVKKAIEAQVELAKVLSFDDEGFYYALYESLPKVNINL